MVIEVVLLRYRVVYHLSRYEPIALQALGLYPGYQRAVCVYIGQLVSKHLHLAIQRYVAQGKGLVGLGQCKVRGHLGIPLIDLSGYCIGRREPHTAPIAIAMD